MPPVNLKRGMNFLWGELLIEELVRNGVDYFCICPGSRSAPLAVAAAENPKARSVVHYDERGAAFYALGYCAASGRPAALIATSGTAGANFYPAVIEASKKKLPLIVLTADRPPELRKTGAPQTIDQEYLFGRYVRWQLDMPCPDKDIVPEYVLTAVDQSVHRSRGEWPGPVHLNCMFRELLAPAETKIKISEAYIEGCKKWMKESKPYTCYEKCDGPFSHAGASSLHEEIGKIKNGIVVVGKLKGGTEREAVLDMAKRLNWPVFADVTSGLRLGCDHPNVISYFDLMLAGARKTEDFTIDGIIHIGGRMTSKRLYQLINECRPSRYVMISAHPLRSDPLHRVTLRIQGRIADVCRAVCGRIKPRTPSNILRHLQPLNRTIHNSIDDWMRTRSTLIGPDAARIVSMHIPHDMGLFLGNSLSVREMDMYGDVRGNAVRVEGNRGASGIDGNVASAIGACRGAAQGMTAMVGDLALLHDLNSLALIREAVMPFVLVVVNNDGGGIFSFLPVAKFDKIFEPYFAAPHGMDFSSLKGMFGLHYSRVSDRASFIREYALACRRKGGSLIEVPVDRTDNCMMQTVFLNKIKNIINKD